MTNREAINIITAKMDVHQAVFGHPVDEPLKTAYDLAISALEKQEADRWIPVTERPPEENGTYLACYEDATVLLDWFNGKWFFYRTNPAVEETGTIIAWRPLPEPYTEEANDKP